MARTTSLAIAAALLASCCVGPAAAAAGALAGGNPSFAATPAPTDQCVEDYACEYCPPNMAGFCFNFKPLCRSGSDPRGMYQARVNRDALWWGTHRPPAHIIWGRCRVPPP